MQIADEMGEQKESFFLVLDGKRRRRRLIPKYEYRSVDHAHKVMVARAGVGPVVMVVLNCHIIEMIGLMAATPRQIRAIAPVALGVILHPGRLGRGLK